MSLGELVVRVVPDDVLQKLCSTFVISRDMTRPTWWIVRNRSSLRHVVTPSFVVRSGRNRVRSIGLEVRRASVGPSARPGDPTPTPITPSVKEFGVRLRSHLKRRVYINIYRAPLWIHGITSREAGAKTLQGQISSAIIMIVIILDSQVEVIEYRLSEFTSCVYLIPFPSYFRSNLELWPGISQKRRQLSGSYLVDW